MKHCERGVLPHSNIYFHTPKERYRKVFLTVNSTGYYFCDDTYKVMRDKYCGYFFQDDTSSVMRNQHGSYLCLFIKDGKGYVYQNGRKIILNKNDTFLLDCYHPHIYGTFTGSKIEMIWVHFDGLMIRECFKQISDNTNCCVLKSLSSARAQTLYNNLFNIYERFDQKKGINDILNNKYLIIVMTEFLQGNALVPDQENNSWDDLLTYISENIQKPLKLKDLAERMALSSYHFIRQFKKEIGYTPYRYVLLAKMSIANHLLKESSLSIKEIAHTCGFSSEGSFCNAFKNISGIWPMAYRENM